MSEIARLQGEITERYHAQAARFAGNYRTPTGDRSQVDLANVEMLIAQAIREAFFAGASFQLSIAKPQVIVVQERQGRVSAPTKPPVWQDPPVTSTATLS